jgi:hypothetical protein
MNSAVDTDDIADHDLQKIQDGTTGKEELTFLQRAGFSRREAEMLEVTHPIREMAPQGGALQLGKDESVLAGFQRGKAPGIRLGAERVA